MDSWIPILKCNFLECVTLFCGICGIIYLKSCLPQKKCKCKVPAGIWEQLYMVIHRFPTKPRSHNKMRDVIHTTSTRSIQDDSWMIFCDERERAMKKERDGQRDMSKVHERYIQNPSKKKWHWGTILEHPDKTKNITLRDLRSWKIDGT